MLGSDYPFPLGEHKPGQLVGECEWLSEEEKKGIWGENCMKFLGLDINQFYSAEK